jgi:hypothetical protein
MQLLTSADASTTGVTMGPGSSYESCIRNRFASVKAACTRRPERAQQLNVWLDPESHAREALSKDNAWALLARMLG